MADEEILQKLNAFEIGSKFISTNFQNLQKNYGNRFVAVKENKILSSSDTFEGLLKEVNPEEVHKENMIIQFIPAKGEIILY